VVTTWTVAAILGIDVADTAGADRLCAIARRLRSAAGVGTSGEARAHGMPDALEAQDELRRDFVAPSLERRRALAAMGRLPGRQDLLSIFIREGLDDELALREVGVFLLGSSNPVSTTVRTVLNLERWFAEHPEDRDRRFDPAFLTLATAETIRLSPPAIKTRRALRDVTVAGIAFTRGDVVAVDQAAVNFDVEEFGPDVAEFNPYRDFGRHRFATSFGGGAHTCIGRRFSIAQDLSAARQSPVAEEPAAGAEHPAGIQVRMLEWLYRAGVELDPEDPPEWRADRRYVTGYDEPAVEQRALVRCHATLSWGNPWFPHGPPPSAP
jgi:cytochrome P450